MITRLWRGWTTVDNADAYERFLLGELVPSMREIPGFRGADILRRFWSTTRPPFITLTRFDSVAAIQASPATITRPGPRPLALALLARYERRALHFGTATFAA